MVILFKEARENEALRQDYLDSVKYLCPNSVERVVYDSDFSKVNVYAADLVEKGIIPKEIFQEDSGPNVANTKFLVVCPLLGLAQQKKQTIFVGPKAFKKYGIEELFLNCLVEHEGFHSTDMMQGIKLADGKAIDQSNSVNLEYATFISILELRAYYNQIAVSRNKNFHPLFIEELEFYFQFCLDELGRKRPRNEFESSLLNNPSVLYMPHIQ